MQAPVIAAPASRQVVEARSEQAMEDINPPAAHIASPGDNPGNQDRPDEKTSGTSAAIQGGLLILTLSSQF